MLEVSVIVPVYNAEKYLRTCLDSLLKQSLRDYEIICVDDGSTDSSSSILEEYKKADGRIRVINKNNEGVAKARYLGVNLALGKYVCFLDSDDWIEEDYLEVLYKAVKENSADLAECAYYDCVGKSKSVHSFNGCDLFLSEEDFKNIVFCQSIINGTNSVVVWNKMYLREKILSEVEEFSENALEDYLFNMQYFVGVKKYVYVNKPLYCYRTTQNSLSHKFNERLYFILKAVQKKKEEVLQRLNLFSKENVFECARWYCRYTERYLKNSPGLAKNKDLLMKILKDDELYKQASFIKGEDEFARLIAEKKYDLLTAKIKLSFIVFYLKAFAKKIVGAFKN